MFQPGEKNQVWSLDFMSDSLWNGRKYILLNVIEQVKEDSTSGTFAVKRAGMKCIGYKNINSGNQDLSEADLIVDEIKKADVNLMLCNRTVQI